jgi:hypothetical protein
MRRPDPARRSLEGLPVLYEKYAGHDNNRDFYMSNLPESINMNKVLYAEWFPQIVYNHHQSGPAGAVMFGPPFRDPFNFNFDPMVPIGIDVVGAAMVDRMAVEGKPGYTSRKGSSYSTWWNGGLRTTPYFHNMIGLLTETIGSPTPASIPFVTSKLLPDSNLYFPIEPQQTWHFRQSIDYSVTANYAVFDVASRNKDHFLYNIYRMGKNSIERGSRDAWTTTPRRIAAAQAALAAARGGRGGRGGTDAAAAASDEAPASTRGAGGGRGATVEEFRTLLRDPARRDPRGFILPSDQSDFPTATKFVNALIRNGITVHRAASAFTVAGKTYPSGSYVIKTAQPFRPHVLDMFEPQDHPDDIPYPGGPPTRPYDNAGWTLAYQMGVKFDRVLDTFDGPFEKVNGLQQPPAGRVPQTSADPVVLDHASNNAFIAVNRLLAAGRDVRWLSSGQFCIVGVTAGELGTLASELGVSFTAAPGVSVDAAIKLRRPRIALADQYGGSMPSGWTRFVLEQFEFPFEVVYPKSLEAGNLSSRFDVIVFPSGVGPAPAGGRGGGAPAGGGRGGALDESDIPEQYRPMLGSYNASQVMPALKAFVEGGGVVVGVGRSTTSLSQLFGLPIANHLVERSADGSLRPVPVEKYYVPGSVLRLAVDNTAPVAQGLDKHVDVFFDNSPVFTLAPDASLKGVRPIAWFDSAQPLRSGWGFGQGYLEGGVEAIEAAVGKGRLFLFAPEITFRGQPHGTFKFLFNALLLGNTH